MELLNRIWILCCFVLFVTSISVALGQAQTADVDAKRVEKANQALKQMYSLLAVENNVADRSKLIPFLLQGEYEKAEKLVKHYEELFQKNPVYEMGLMWLVEDLDYGNEDIQKKLDKWVEQKPSYISYGFRGVSRTILGFNIRGGKTISQTPPENLRKMQETHQMAKEDLTKAIKENPAFVLAYESLVQIAMSTASKDTAKVWHDRAVLAIPKTYWVRKAYAKSLYPRWGGSYDLMRRYAKDLTKESDQNPLIWFLKGEEQMEKGFSALVENRFAQAIQFYSNALKYGDNLSLLESRAVAYYNTKQYDLAIADYKKFLEYSPSDQRVKENIDRLNNMIADETKKADRSKKNSPS